MNPVDAALLVAVASLILGGGAFALAGQLIWLLHANPDPRK